MTLVALVLAAAVDSTESSSRQGNRCPPDEMAAFRSLLVAWLSDLQTWTSSGKEVAELVFTSCDSNENSVLEVTELRDCLMDQLRDESLRDDCFNLFAMMIDRNGNGVIDEEELGGMVAVVKPTCPL